MIDVEHHFVAFYIDGGKLTPRQKLMAEKDKRNHWAGLH